MLDVKQHCCTRNGQFRACIQTLITICGLVLDNKGNFPTERDIAQARGISSSTVGRHIAELVERGFIAETDTGYLYVVDSAWQFPRYWGEIWKSPCNPDSDES